MPGYSKQWRRVARQAKEQAERDWLLGKVTYCTYCGGGIDMTLPRNEGMDFTMDHRVTRLQGGADTIDNAEPMHRSCNTKRRHSIVPMGDGHMELHYNRTREW